ncbi:Transcription antitermination factor NusG [Filimonas lacunae]|uniref:Transcription antitermination factor NusG n=1 Tax=Filimonas lacunae TaxID=477680 RepID=A0A173MGJ0_9BACT|nr:UpxY family transcription antiterminator [Filimonas lacunae]BAV06609.1 transcriptional activator RfaH [Filimonas lacunae]SIT27570.1 Transcription antitermination factor NusG [Filimonas lacunae]
MDNFQQGWRVIYTKSRHEKKVATQLQDLSLDAYLPCVKKLHHWCDRKKIIDAPLFPSYVFVHLKHQQHYFKSLGVEGVLSYVKVGKEIAKVSDSVINSIQLVVGKGSDLEVCDDYLRPGKTLCIKDGPFTGFTCEVVEYKGKQKIVVRVALLQRSILLNLSSDILMEEQATLQMAY